MHDLHVKQDLVCIYVAVIATYVYTHTHIYFNSLGNNIRNLIPPFHCILVYILHLLS